MADINVERKRDTTGGSPWGWIIGLIVLLVVAGAIWALVRNDDQEGMTQPAAEQPAAVPGASFQADPVQTPPPPVGTDPGAAGSQPGAPGTGAPAPGTTGAPGTGAPGTAPGATGRDTMGAGAPGTGG
jgi:hypothetical protein